MFGTLLESRAGRRRRPGGAAVSVAVHVAVIAAVTATTVRGSGVKAAKPETVVVHFAKPPAPPPPVVRATGSIATGPITVAPIQIRHIEVPRTIPVTLPPINPSSGGADSIVIGGSTRPGLARAVLEGTDEKDPGEWRGADLQTRILASARPRYPESLRQAAIDGTVLVRFVVDTIGRVDMSSVAVISSTHDLFTRAVRDALPGFRFKPSESGGHRVRALAEMPFEFQITK